MNKMLVRINFVFAIFLTILIVPIFGYHLMEQSDLRHRQKRQFSNCRLKFVCETNDACVQWKKICDGVDDCPDGSDEKPEICSNQTSLPADSCSPPSIKNGRFEVLGDNYIADGPIPNYSLVNIFCNSGYIMVPPTVVIGCLDGSWSSPVPKCVYRCPPRPSTVLYKVECIANDKPVNCSEHMEEGAVAIAKCRNYYSDSNNYATSICIKNTWDTPPPYCETQCGEAFSEATELISNPKSAKRARFPWHVGIYRLEDENYKYQCGGAIISPSIIVSAAHCIANSGIKTPAEELYVAAGKFFNNYGTKRDAFSQKRKVKEYLIPPSYSGAATNFIGDFAVIVVQRAFQMTNAIQPVCVDWNNNILGPLQSNETGDFVGWRYEMDAELRSSNVPFIDRAVCYNKVANHFKQYITRDKFCADAKNVSAVCLGYSGGGIYSEHNGKYYIRGILSVGDGDRMSLNNNPCDNPNGVYTNVTEYLDLIRKAQVNNPVKQTSLACPPRTSSSAIINCTLDGDPVDCSEPLEDGAVSISRCKPFFTSLQGNEIISVCTNGTWDKPLVQCEPECGEDVPDGVIYITQGIKATKGQFPWSVGIYREENKKMSLQYICGGIIITPTIVLSTAHCFTTHEGIQNPPEDYYIGAGKYYIDYDNIKDVFAQKRQVKKFYIPDTFRGYILNYLGDLAAVVVDKPFEMTNVVRPVCVDWLNDSEFQTRSNQFGVLLGWGSSDSKNVALSPELLQLKAPYVDTKTCLRELPSDFAPYVTVDKFCAGYSNGTSPAKGDSGNGLAFELDADNRYYVRGLLSTGVRDSSVAYTLYTNISYYTDFIRNVIQQNEEIEHTCPPRASNSVNIQCTLSGIPVDCSQPVVEGVIAVGQCNEGFRSITVRTSVATCVDKRWNKPLIHCEQVQKIDTCPALVSESVNVKCILNDKPVNCNRPLEEGTVAISECKDLYIPREGELPISVSRCSNGAWNNPLIQCLSLQPVKLECGEAVSDGEVYAINAAKAKKGEFPWHVGIYRHSTSKYDYNCGGSIITPKIILTAAHCFTDEYGVRYPAEEFYIGAGKYYSDYNSAEDEHAQKRQVKEYHIPPTYRGYWTNFAGDLAVTVVKISFELTNLVQPVCLEWDNKIEAKQLRPYSRGSVVGWGTLDPRGQSEPSPELKQLTAPYIGIQQCLDNVPKNFRRWVTTDKFCAGFTNGSSVCKGDSGGGMVFEWTANNTQKFYLRGIVSAGPSDKKKSLICDNFKYGTYTKVSFYNTFILTIIKFNMQ